MRILREIYRRPGDYTRGRVNMREAVRAVVRRDGLILLVHSEKNGDYKFPGGRVEAGETHPAALARELAEECGVRLATVESGYGRVLEFDRAFEPGSDIFQMISYYYLCQITTEQNPPQLEPYERELGFHPEWVTLAAAIAANQQVLARTVPKAPTWTQRETFVLVHLLANGG